MEAAQYMKTMCIPWLFTTFLQTACVCYHVALWQSLSLSSLAWSRHAWAFSSLLIWFFFFLILSGHLSRHSTIITFQSFEGKKKKKKKKNLEKKGVFNLFGILKVGIVGMLLFFLIRPAQCASKVPGTVFSTSSLFICYFLESHGFGGISMAPAKARTI